MTSQIVGKGGYPQLPAGVDENNESLSFPDLEYHVVRLSERHGPDESQYSDVKIWNNVPGHPVNSNVELMRHNSNSGISKFGMTYEEACKLAIAFLEVLPQDTFDALLAQVEHS